MSSSLRSAAAPHAGLRGALGDGRPATILVNQLGYGEGPARRVIVALKDPRMDVCLTLLHSDGHRTPIPLSPPSTTSGWSIGEHCTADLPPGLPVGAYELRLDTLDAPPVRRRIVIGPDRWQLAVVSDVLSYFRSVRSFGEIDRKDRTARFYDSPDLPPVDARGGWLDASGDFSKFLSHMTYTDAMSPQQIPLCAWAMLVARDELAATHPRIAAVQGSRLRDEGLFGADFLTRFQAPEGYFYTGIFDALTKNLEERVITAPLQDSVRTKNWRAGWRHGGGMAIAALAKAAMAECDGDVSRDAYYDAAVRGHRHLLVHGASYVPSGENVLDDYCALAAATELAQAADQRRDAGVKAVAQEQVTERAQRLVDAVDHDARGRAFLRLRPGGQPFFHAVESGLPVITLLRAADLLDDLPVVREPLIRRVRSAAVDLVGGTIGRATACANPFSYPRHVVAAPDSGNMQDGGEVTEQFFFPHDNETGYWWQGENANIASLAYAALLAARHVQGETAELFRTWAENLLGWVTGLNPYDICMLQGRGAINVEYSEIFQNLPGGIVNGITGGMEDESDIDLSPADAVENGWRWNEQWIPHSAWFLLAICAAR